MVYVLDITSLYIRPWIRRNITSKRALDHLYPPSSWLHQRLGNIGQITICQTIHPYAIQGILFVAYSQGLGSMDCRCMVWRIVDNSFIHANDTSMILLWYFFVNKKEKCHCGIVLEIKWLGADGYSEMRLWYFFDRKMFRVNGIKGVSTDAFWQRTTHPNLPKEKELVTQNIVFSPHLASPEGEGQLLLILIIYW